MIGGASVEDTLELWADHWLCATTAMIPPICLVPSARNAVLVPPSSCRRSTARRWPSIFGKSARRLRRARTPCWCSTVPAGIKPANVCQCQTISACCRCHPMRQSSTRSKTSGNFCAATSSAISHQVWNSYDEILAACRNAWNKFMQMPEQIASITQRDWIKKVIG